MVSWLTRGALEILSENALGYTFDPITEDHKEHPYVTAVKGLGYVQPHLMHFLSSQAVIRLS